MGRRAVILDVDGTLVDTNYQHALAWYMAFREHDVVVAVWRIHRHLGMGGDQIVAALAGEQVEAELGDDLRAAHDALYLASIQTVSAFESARELLRDLAAAGARVILASSAKPREIEHYVDLLSAREIVEGWTTAEDVQRTKPNPDLVLAALERLGEGREDAVMVGDTPWDVEAARRAGVPTVAVLTGGFSVAELEDAGAVAVHESVGDLRGHLDELVGAAG
ncbi:MAG TPA: HAD family hydrolase [Solirubrobacteraceae bacterium]|jgi:HAD superfamily hydrolase (TIGR01549 family)